MTRGSIARAATLVAVVTALSRLVGFARVVVFAHAVGPSCLGDAYYTANTVPNILFDIVAGGALSSLVVPLLAPAADSGDNERADRIMSALLCWALLLLTPVVVIGVVLSGPIAHLLIGAGHPGCAAAQERAVGARMLQVFMPQVLLYGVGVVFIGVLQSHRRFLAAAAAPIVSSGVVIAAYLAFASLSARSETRLIDLARSHELVLSVGTTLGVAALSLPLWLPVRRAGRRLRATLSFPPGIATAARRLAIAGAVVLGSQDLATAVVLRLANARGSAGAVVLYNLAWTLFLLPWSVLAVPVATAAFPRLAARWHEGRHADYDATVARTTTAVAVAMVGAAALLVAVAGPAARVLILGAPGTVAPRLLGGALAAFAPGLVGYGIVAMLSRSHYARGDARTPAVATAAGWAVAVGADLAVTAVAPRQWIAAALGGGVAIGMSVAGGLLLLAQRRAAAASLAGAAPAGARALAAGVPAAAAGVLVARLVPAGSVAASIGATVAVAAVTLASYLLLLLVLGGSAQLRALHVVRDG